MVVFCCPLATSESGSQRIVLHNSVTYTVSVLCMYTKSTAEKQADAYVLYVRFCTTVNLSSSSDPMSV